MQAFSIFLFSLILLLKIDNSVQLDETEIDNIKNRIGGRFDSIGCLWDSLLPYLRLINTCSSCNLKILCEGTAVTARKCSGSNMSIFFGNLNIIFNAVKPVLNEYEASKIRDVIGLGNGNRCSSFGCEEGCKPK